MATHNRTDGGETRLSRLQRQFGVKKSERSNVNRRTEIEDFSISYVEHTEFKTRDAHFRQLATFTVNQNPQLPRITGSHHTPPQESNIANPGAESQSNSKGKDHNIQNGPTVVFSLLALLACCLTLVIITFVTASYFIPSESERLMSAAMTCLKLLALIVAGTLALVGKKMFL
eukprot:gene15124-16680_t